MSRLVRSVPHSPVVSVMSAAKGDGFFKAILKDVLKDVLKDSLKNNPRTTLRTLRWLIPDLFDSEVRKTVAVRSLLFGVQFAVSKYAIVLLRKVPTKVLPKVLVGPAGILVGTLVLLIPEDSIKKLLSRPIDRVTVMIDEKVQEAKNNSPDVKRKASQGPVSSALSLFNPKRGRVVRSFRNKTTKRRSSANKNWMTNLPGMFRMKWSDFSVEIPTAMAGVFMALDERFLSLLPKKEDEPIKPIITKNNISDDAWE